MDKDSEKPGTEAAFDYDRVTVERFRQTFPRARWNDVRKTWFVPGTTAERRIARWRALETSKADIHADAKGRDAYAFDPIVSPYLEAGDYIIVRTPYSRTVVSELRQVPFARWDDEERVWLLPFRSYEALKRRWPAIEEAAKRNEPEERRRRQNQLRNTEEFKRTQLRQNERRKRRYPVPADNLPPIGRPVSTPSYGIIIVSEITGELADAETLASFYGELNAENEDFVWVIWRTPNLAELVRAWPSKRDQNARGWWLPTKEELVAARKAARARERRHSRGMIAER
jgi:hypothetical protein